MTVQVITKAVFYDVGDILEVETNTISVDPSKSLHILRVIHGINKKCNNITRSRVRIINIEDEPELFL